METLAGIDSTTIARLLVDVDQGNGLAPGSVLVVDEAGMVGSRTIDRLAQHAADTESKLVLVGDDRQLPEIDAGGAFRRLARDLGAIELHQVHRQVEAWDREALAQLRQGKVQLWSEAYRDHGRLVARPTADELRATLVEDWWQAARQPDAGDAVIIAHRRSDVADLNALARERMARDSRLGEEELTTDRRAFAVGDRVIARRNDRRAGVVNGTRGEVVGVDMDARSVAVRVADGTERTLASQYLDDGWLDHAYALTAHAAQGATVDRSFVLGSDELYREWGYTALSRHRDQARFYIVSPGSVERALPVSNPRTTPSVRTSSPCSRPAGARSSRSMSSTESLVIAPSAPATKRSERSRRLASGSTRCAPSRPSLGVCGARAVRRSSRTSRGRKR
jgi:ATP-dependent exoDNAse (exonuclease V) alpha subunit